MLCLKYLLNLCLRGALKSNHLHKPYNAANIQVVPFVATLQVNNLGSDYVHVQ